MDLTMIGRMGRKRKISSNQVQLFDDFSDRLNYKFSSILIVILIVVTGVRQYFGKPMQCWVPQDFTKAWEEYTESYCAVSNNYLNLGLNPSMPNQNDREEVKYSYYQWESIVLGVQILMFCIPCIFWRISICLSKFNLQRIMGVAQDANSFAPDHLRQNIKSVTIHMDKCLDYKDVSAAGLNANIKRAVSRDNGRSCGLICGNYLSFLYIGMKLLYLLNIVGQLYLMQSFIGTPYTFHGVQVLYNLVNGIESPSSGNLPRVTICDFIIKKLGRIHRYAVQCSLPMNMFLEKIFVFLWFWHIVVGCITLISLICWMIRLINRNHRFQFIKEYLEIMDVVKSSDEGWIRNFVFNYLRLDGLFVIHLISINVGDIVAANVVCELWSLYQNQQHNEYDEPSLVGYQLANV